MQPPCPTVLVLIGLGLGLTAPLPDALAADKPAPSRRVRIKRPWRAGTRLRVQHTVTRSLFVRRIVRGRASSERLQKKAALDGRLKVLAARDGEWQKLRTAIKTLTETTQTDDDAPRVRRFGATDQDVIIERHDDGLAFATADGEPLARADRELLAQFFSPPAATTPDDAFAPDREVAVGDRWAIDAQALAALFNGAGQAVRVQPDNISGTMTLTAVDAKTEPPRLLVRGEAKLHRMQAVARRVFRVDAPNAAAVIKLAFDLPTDTARPERVSRLEFKWAFQGTAQGNAAVRVSVRQQLVKHEELTLLKAADDGGE